MTKCESAAFQDMATKMLEPATVMDSYRSDNTPHPPDRSTFRILHITDLHFRKSDRLDTVDNLAKRIARSLEDCRPIDFIAITGDLLDNGSFWIPSNFACLSTARSFLNLLGKHTDVPDDRIRIVPGNHDYKWCGLLRLPKMCRPRFDDFFDKFSKPVMVPWRKTGLLFYPFDSVRLSSAMSMARGVAGQVPERDEILACIPADFNHPVLPIALIHHHPLPVPLSELEPTGLNWWKRFWWRATNDPSSLLLKDAGKFLASLKTCRFRLVLHGHLHRPGHWCLYSNTGENEVWLDIVSSACLIQSEAPSRVSYSIIELSSDLALGGFHRTYDDLPQQHTHDTEIRFPSSKATRGHGLLRKAAAPSVVNERGAVRETHVFERQGLVRCREFIQYWHIGLRTGTLTCIKHLKGLSADDSAGIRDLCLPTSNIDHALADVSAHSLTDRRDLKVDPLLTSSEQSSRYYKILLRSPLTRRQPQDIVCRCDYSALLPRDLVDLERMGIVESEGHRSISQRVVWQCERLVTLLEFDLPYRGVEPQFPTPTVSICDTNGLTTEIQPSSEHAFLDSWPIHNLPKYRLSEFGTGTLMLAYRLKPGTQVSITWTNPVPVARDKGVSLMQSRLLDFRRRQDFVERLKGGLELFLESCAHELELLVGKYHPERHHGEREMFLVLYCLSRSEAQHRFVSLASLSLPSGQERDLEWVFGNNIVTRAYRYCECNYFVGSAVQGSDEESVIELPGFAEGARHLLAVPIFDIFSKVGDRVGLSSVDSGIGEATLVLLLGSMSDASELAYASPGSPLMDEFIGAVQIWGRVSLLRNEQGIQH